MPPNLKVEIYPLTPARWRDFEKLFGSNGACAVGKRVMVNLWWSLITGGSSYKQAPVCKNTNAGKDSV